MTKTNEIIHGLTHQEKRRMKGMGERDVTLRDVMT